MITPQPTPQQKVDALYRLFITHLNTEPIEKDASYALACLVAVDKEPGMSLFESSRRMTGLLLSGLTYGDFALAHYATEIDQEILDNLGDLPNDRVWAFELVDRRLDRALLRRS